MALAAAAGGWFWLTQLETARPTATAPPPAGAPAQPDRQAASPATAQPPVLQAPREDEAVKADGVTAALVGLLGRDAVLKFLETTDFPRRFAATLDNLGREHAPVAAWPVHPMPGRFVVEGDGTSQVIAAENALRYAPFVAFVNSVNVAQAVDLYRRMSPLLEQAYHEQGFPGRSLHQRLLQVIDLLLATPEPQQPPRITLTEVKGPLASARPWTRYEYADAGLQRLAAGQKMLLRVGPENRKVLKAKLKEFRDELLRVSSQRP